ncbi:unnamed protein product [Caenorhabditis bovis]|uniref:Innexin n=1 Tax=Caenorhabditis bovis TaxID=2654633 RepID=A0A8S1E7G0_9PELO|nr:unnamed protein product [Caenorhabditis bovis]
MHLLNKFVRFGEEQLGLRDIWKAHFVGIYMPQALPVGYRNCKLPFFGNNYVYSQLCNNITCFILIAFAIILVWKHKIGEPMSCKNRNFTNIDLIPLLGNSDVDCFAGKFKFAFNGTMIIPGIGQYTHVALFLTSMMFVALKLIWNKLEKSTDFWLDEYLQITMKIKDLSVEQRTKGVEEMTNKINEYKKASGSIFGSRSPRLNAYVTFKLMCIGCLGLQFILMRYITGDGFNLLWGIKNLSSKSLWTSFGMTTNFPHRINCGVHPLIRDDVYVYTTSCIIGLNVLNDVLFSALAIWLSFVLFFLALDCAKYMFEIGRHSHTKKLLKKIYNTNISNDQAARFYNYIGFDGLVIMKTVFDVSDIVGKHLIQNFMANEIAKRFEDEIGEDQRLMFFSNMRNMGEYTKFAAALEKLF